MTQASPLSAATRDDEGNGRVMKLRTTPPQGELERIGKLVTAATEALVHAHALLADLTGPGVGGCDISRGSLSLHDGQAWRAMIRYSIRGHLYRVGRKGADILIRMLDEPDAFINQDELAGAARVKAGSRATVKVYISHLRNALEDHGISPAAIETGRYSYRLCAWAVPDIIALLTQS